MAMDISDENPIITFSCCTTHNADGCDDSCHDMLNTVHLYVGELENKRAEPSANLLRAGG